jgi:hypothetical protein
MTGPFSFLPHGTIPVAVNQNFRPNNWQLCAANGNGGNSNRGALLKQVHRMARPAAFRLLDCIPGDATGVIDTAPKSGGSDSSSPASLNLTTRIPAGKFALLQESFFSH